MSYRLEKFASTLRQSLGEILSQESLDPGLKRAVVVRVQLSRDLKRATVFVACPAGAEAATLAQLAGAAGFIKKQLAARMILRHMPELEFVGDAALEFENRLASQQGAAPLGGLASRQGAAPSGDWTEAEKIDEDADR